MPSQWSISLDGPTTPQIPAEAPHAVVSRWLDADHNAAVKPYSIAPPSTRGNRTTIQVRLLDDSLAGRVATHAAEGSVVRLGRHRFTIAAQPVLEHGCSWAALAATGLRRTWEVSYLSPVTFRRRNRTSPWPSPDSVLTSLASRWRALDPATAPTITPQMLRSVWVCDVEGRSQPFTLKDTIVSGFIGQLRYVCDGTEPEAAAVSALFAFAQYAGIGSHTAFGLGTASIAHPNSPRTTQRRLDREPTDLIDLDRPPSDGIHSGQRSRPAGNGVT